LSSALVKANLFLRLSSSFACVTVKLVVGWKRETVLAHIVGGVHFEGAKMFFYIEVQAINKQRRTRKDEKRTSIKKPIHATSK